MLVAVPAHAAPTAASLRQVNGAVTVVAPGAVKDVFANCAPGKRRAGGGYAQPFNTTESGIVL